MALHICRQTLSYNCAATFGVCLRNLGPLLIISLVLYIVCLLYVRMHILTSIFIPFFHILFPYGIISLMM